MEVGLRVGGDGLQNKIDQRSKYDISKQLYEYFIYVFLFPSN